MRDSGSKINTKLEREWQAELTQKPERLNWYGWEDGSKVQYFNDMKIDSKCVRPCKECGFYYLNSKGDELKRTDTPLCGVW
jgi:hypothetical protein